MVESVNVNEVVEAFLGKTLQGKMQGAIAKYIINGISNNKGSVQIPVLQKMFELFPEFKSKCIDIYHGVFGLNEYVTEIPDDIKAAQGAVLDGLCIMYDWGSGRDLGIVTLNNRLIDPSEEDVVDAKVEAKIMECNRVGLIHSYRYDFEYNNYGPETAKVKCVKHRTKVDEDSVILIPLVATIAIADIIRSQMVKGKMLAVRVVSGSGEEKHRVVTENSVHLAHYCDSSCACMGLSSEYYLLGSFMYAPVVGAPSTTAMKSRIDFLNLETMLQVNSYQQCASFGITKVKDPVGVLLMEEAILTKLMEMKAVDPDGFTRMVSSLPESYVFGNMLDGDISARVISNYLHTLSDSKVVKLMNSIPGATEAFKVRSEAVGSGESKGTVGAEDLYSTLKSKVVKIVWKTPKGVYASNICTNSRDILRKVYGDDYFGKYESVGVRISNAIDDMRELGMPIDVACRTYGFDESVVEKLKKADIKGDMEEAFYEALGKKKRVNSKSEGVITARTLGGYLGGKIDEGNTNSKAEDYYVSIDTTHLVRAEVLG